MCGIVGCISNEATEEILYNGITQLKNRGYDSVGICSIQNKEFIVDKYASSLKIDAYVKLQEKLYKHSDS